MNAMKATKTVPLRNRVTPFGEIVAVPDRGMLMGNSGCLHDVWSVMNRLQK